MAPHLKLYACTDLLPLSLLQLSIACLLCLQVQLEVVHLGGHLGCFLPGLSQRAVKVLLLALRVGQLHNNKKSKNHHLTKQTNKQTKTALRTLIKLTFKKLDHVYNHLRITQLNCFKLCVTMIVSNKSLKARTFYNS